MPSRMTAATKLICHLHVEKLSLVSRLAQTKRRCWPRRLSTRPLSDGSQPALVATGEFRRHRQRLTVPIQGSMPILLATLALPYHLHCRRRHLRRRCESVGGGECHCLEGAPGILNTDNESILSTIHIRIQVEIFRKGSGSRQA